MRRLGQLHDRAKLPLVLRGRRFTYRGLRTIIECAATHYPAGRTRISEAVCIRLNWRQPNGWLKDRACRDVLHRLARLRLIRLPPRLDEKDAGSKRGGSETRRDKLPPDLIRPLSTMPRTLFFQFAKGNAAERLWNVLVERYHYLGHTVQVGRCLKYLIWGDGHLLGAISFSSPAWKLAVRDELMKQLGYTDRHARDFVINNSRFLILPNIQVPHLASRVLSAAIQRAVFDWSWFYAITPVMAETFVEPRRFEGTCYRAANWIEIGKTNGYAKVGASHHNSQRPKTLFVYGLTRSHRRRLPVVIQSLHIPRST